MGKIRTPFYRIVVADSRTKRDGRVIEEIGTYNPKADPSVITVVSDRAQYWLGVGAQPTDTVRSLLRRAGVLKRRHEARLGIEHKATAVPVRETPEDAPVSA